MKHLEKIATQLALIDTVGVTVLVVVAIGCICIYS